MQKRMPDTATRGRQMYILQAALEYFVSILVAGSFLAALTKQLGFSDGLTGILSSVISLGCVFQLLSLTIRPKRVKGLVLALSIANQLLFLLLFLIPVFPVGKNGRIALFILCIVLAYLLYYIAHPKKISWFMSHVDDSIRGRFTANKEIISLLSGMVFSFVMGAVADHFAEKGQIQIAFILFAAVIFVLMVFHSLCMVFTGEKPQENPGQTNLLQSLRQVMTNPKILQVALVFLFYHMAIGVCIPFYGTYQIGELGLGLTLVSALGILSSLSRAAISRFWGRYADKRTFAKMMEKCLLVMALSFLCVAFAVPANGLVMLALYYVLYGISMGGVNSALTNLVFDYVSHENRADSLAICQAIAGIAGFLCTLAASGLVEYIQQNGNRFLGLDVYAQQVVSVLGAGFVMITILCVRKVGRTNE